MKKVVSILTIFLVLFLSIFSVNVYAEKLQTLNIIVDKETVHPNETVTLTAEFGQELGSYTFNIAYDNRLLEYVSSEGGEANDLGTKVKLTYYDKTAQSNPRSSMSVTFKAKADITTSNPTNFSVTAEGLATSDAGTRYDDVDTPIVKSIMVEPLYVDYNIALNYTGDVIVNEAKDMDIVISSSMGKNYEHTKIVAEVSGPENASVKLLATDEDELEHDIIQSEWGAAEGDPLGGKDVIKKLQTRAIFSEVGNYTLKLKLINRDDSDKEIASSSFQISVKQVASEVKPDNSGTTKPEEKPNTKPNSLPKTGQTVYLGIFVAIFSLIAVYAVLDKKVK